jgi:hypothetical protein
MISEEFGNWEIVIRDNDVTCDVSKLTGSIAFQKVFAVI